MPPDKIILMIPTTIRICGIPHKPGSKIVCMKSPGHLESEHEYYKFFRKYPKKLKSILKIIPSHRCNLYVSYIKKFTINEQLTFFPDHSKTLYLMGFPVYTQTTTSTATTVSYDTVFFNDVYHIPSDYAAIVWNRF